MIRVVLADDQELLRDGFAMILGGQDDIDVVGLASDGAQAVALVKEHRPHVVLMDIRMPVMDGIEATSRIVSELPHCAVVVLTTFDLDEYVYRALRAGAVGYLLKDAPRAVLLAAVRTAAAGGTVLAPLVAGRLVEAFGVGAVDPTPLAPLSEREQEVLARVARGRNNTEIAQELFISEATVKSHIGHILDKTGRRDRVNLVVLGYETGLLHPGQ